MLNGDGKKREERNGNMEHDGNECFSLFFFVKAFADGNDRSVKKAKLDGERKRDDLDLCLIFFFFFFFFFSSSLLMAL
jgi:hypothetical protein